MAPLIFLFAAVSMVLLAWPETCLTIRNGDKLLCALPIARGEFFEISFTHSLNLSPVTDVIEWTGSEMMVRKSVFKTFGAGIPIPADGVGTELVRTGDAYELLQIDKPLQSFAIMMQRLPDHSIRFRGRTIRLLALAEPGQSVEISVRQVPRLFILSENLR